MRGEEKRKKIKINPAKGRGGDTHPPPARPWRKEMLRRQDEKIKIAVSAIVGAVLLVALVASRGNSFTGHIELIHWGTFSQEGAVYRGTVRAEARGALLKDDYLHAHKDDRSGFPKAEYHKDDDADLTASTVDAAEKKMKLLSSREEAARKAADLRAAADLSNYNSVFSSGIDEYAKVSHAIDEQSRKVFLRSITPKIPPKPAYDPLSDERKLWKKMGVQTDGVLGVPHEYAGWHATATANPAELKHLPDYVQRAQEEVESGGAVAMAANGWHSKPIVQEEQAQPARSGTPR
jgi:hypothetical protein